MSNQKPIKDTHVPKGKEYKHNTKYSHRLTGREQKKEGTKKNYRKKNNPKPKKQKKLPKWQREPSCTVGGNVN